MSKIEKLAPLPILVIILSFLCPTELSLYVAGLRLPPHRVALIVLLPFALFRMTTSRDIRIRGFDVAMLAYAAWTLFVYTLHSGHAGFVYGGSLVVELLGGYAVARAFVRTSDELRATMRAFVFAVIAAALIALPETLLGEIYTHTLLRQLTGYEHPIGVESRLGLTRAYGTFDHPIHYGTFCAALLALFWYAERRTARRRINAAAMSCATFLGISSAPMLCLALQIAMLAWERLSRTITARVPITLGIFVALYLVMSAVSSRSPIALLATGMTLDPWTGFYRLQIWDAGIGNVLASPFTGIGLADWERPWWMVSDTVDAFWLVTMMRQGIPAILLLALAIALLARDVIRRRHRHADRDVRRIAMGWMMTVIALSLIGATVHYWNVLHAYFFFVIGLGGWIADPARRATATFGALDRDVPVAASRAKTMPALGRPYPSLPGEVAIHARPYAARA